MEELKRQLQPKRARTHDAGDAHEMLAEVDNWDLSVNRREATRVQNRSISAAAGTAASGASMEGQAAAAVVTALRDARTPVDQQPRHKRCDVSEEEFERRYAVVQDENFWGWL